MSFGALLGQKPIPIQQGYIVFTVDWTDEGNGWYSQVVEVLSDEPMVDKNSKIDLQLPQLSMNVLEMCGVTALYVENNNNTLTAHIKGADVTTSWYASCTATEIEPIENESIMGDMITIARGNPIPRGNYVTFYNPAGSLGIALPSGVSGLNNVEYSDDGISWTTVLGQSVSSANGVVCLRGTSNLALSNPTHSWSLSSGDNPVYCFGNLETVFDYTAVANGQHPSVGSSNICRKLFKQSKLITAPWCGFEHLPVESFEESFYGCESLVVGADIKATTTDDSVFSQMYTNCSNLKLLCPIHIAEATGVCFESFCQNCVSLRFAPALPAPAPTAHGVFTSAFSNCDSLIKPALMNLTLVTNDCCDGMYGSCSNLRYLIELPAVGLAKRCYRTMFNNCPQIKLSTTQSAEYPYEYRIPTTSSGTDAEDALASMFVATGGTFTGTPTINTTYYCATKPISTT